MQIYVILILFIPVLSQQRLISLLESERDELTKKASSLTVSNVELEEENKKVEIM